MACNVCTLKSGLKMWKVKWMAILENVGGENEMTLLQRVNSFAINCYY